MKLLKNSSEFDELKHSLRSVVAVVVNVVVVNVVAVA
jgi:hypothetical protein